MVFQFIAEFFGNFTQPFFQFFILELRYQSALDADNVIVAVAGIKLKQRLPAVEAMTGDKTSCLKLSKDSINRGKADLGVFGKQRLVDVLRAHVMLFSVLENLENFQARQGDLQAGTLEVGSRAERGSL